MKKLGVMEEEGDSTDDMLLNYFRLFSGPLSEPVIKAMMALCGLGRWRGSHLLPGLELVVSPCPAAIQWVHSQLPCHNATVIFSAGT